MKNALKAGVIGVMVCGGLFVFSQVANALPLCWGKQPTMTIPSATHPLLCVFDECYIGIVTLRRDTVLWIAPLKNTKHFMINIPTNTSNRICMAPQYTDVQIDSRSQRYQWIQTSNGNDAVYCDGLCTIKTGLGDDIIDAAGGKAFAGPGDDHVSTQGTALTQVNCGLGSNDRLWLYSGPKPIVTQCEDVEDFR